MGIFGVLGAMGLIGAVGAAGKKIVEKVESGRSPEKNAEQTVKYASYIINNILRIDKQLSDLIDETKSLISSIAAASGARMSFKEKSDLKKSKRQVNINLKYLYLSKDFFTALSRNASGIMLKKAELKLVSRFSPFFDGVSVLQDEDAFEGYLEKYEEELERATIPDVKGAIDSFKNVIGSPNVPCIPQTTSVSCPCCGAKQSDCTLDECEYCGTSLK